MLRLVHGAWPDPNPPSTALEVFHREIVKSYDTWLRNLRGLHPLARGMPFKIVGGMLSRTSRDRDVRTIELDLPGGILP